MLTYEEMLVHLQDMYNSGCMPHYAYVSSVHIIQNYILSQKRIENKRRQTERKIRLAQPKKIREGASCKRCVNWVKKKRACANKECTTWVFNRTDESALVNALCIMDELNELQHTSYAKAKSYPSLTDYDATYTKYR